jgi:metal-dependent amidase/aminoacylase/carboxypeptidase family protein
VRVLTYVCVLEIAYEEVKAHDNICAYLEEQGCEVTRHYLGMPTAFMAEFINGSGSTIAFCAEYDALPDIGNNKAHSKSVV